MEKIEDARTTNIRVDIEVMTECDALRHVRVLIHVSSVEDTVTLSNYKYQMEHHPEVNGGLMLTNSVPGTCRSANVMCHLGQIDIVDSTAE